MSRIIPITYPGVAKIAAEVLARGDLIVLPTDTVYGLGSRIETHAIDRIFAAKQRPPDRAVPVLLADADAVSLVAREFPETARRLAAAFWPGPLTLRAAPAGRYAGQPDAPAHGRRACARSRRGAHHHRGGGRRGGGDECQPLGSTPGADAPGRGAVSGRFCGAVSRWGCQPRRDAFNCSDIRGRATASAARRPYLRSDAANSDRMRLLHKPDRDNHMTQAEFVAVAQNTLLIWGQLGPVEISAVLAAQVHHPNSPLAP